MRTARSITSGENFGDFLMLAPFSIEGASSEVGAVQMLQREQSRQLTGRVDIDDAYLGGKVQGGKAGRGSPNKVPFVAAVQTTESGEPVLVCLSKRPFTKESIKAFAATSLAAPATLVSDGLGCFTVIQGTALLHEPHVIGGGCQRQAPVVLGRQHRAGQLEDRVGRHLSRLLLRKVRPSISRPSGIPLQSAL
jgi:hypothetical protein